MEHSPHQLLHHGVILILATAVISVQTGGGLAEAIIAEEKVQPTDNCVCPLACLTGLINNKVHLPCAGFTAHPKDGGFPWCQKIDRTRLLWVARLMHLLHKG